MTDANAMFVALLGGTALLLYGVRLVGEELQRAAGTRLRHILQALSGDRLRALLVRHLEASTSTCCWPSAR